MAVTTVPVRLYTTAHVWTVQAELADTKIKRNTGLMHRTSLPQDAGMLFVFETEAIQSFWMKDTPLSLDMIFMDANKEIVYIEEGTTPLSKTPITPPVLVKYVLEVAAFGCREHGVKIGDHVMF